MKKLVLTLTVAIIFAWQGSSFAASSVDALIQKLEDKGILTPQEANQVKGEIASKEKNSQETTFKTLLPDWLNNIKITGDFRIRDQLQVRKVPISAGGHNFDQNRARIRARINFEDQINDKVKIVVGIATDGGTARSNNYTLGGSKPSSITGVTNTDSFGKPQVVLNRAYAVYTPNDMITVMGGKLDNPIWEPNNSSFLWDPDITPEGGAIQVQKRLNDYVTPWAQGVIFDLHDLSPSTAVKTDPYMMVTQGGIKGNLTDQIYYKLGVTWYDINNPSHLVLNESLGTNSMTVVSPGAPGSSVLRYNFNNIIVEGADIGINDPFGELLPSPIYVAQAGVFGDFAKNGASQDIQNKAWEMGAYMGNSAINGWGTWKLQSYYKVIERDSWLDALPDDDFYSGYTDTKGWRTQLDIGLAKNVWFTMSYFHTNIFKDVSSMTGLQAALGATSSTSTTTFRQSAPEDLFQMDLNFKF